MPAKSYKNYLKTGDDMQDNYKPSSELTNKAWENMRAALDREMPLTAGTAPQEKRRRRFLLWWFVGAAAALLIAVTTFMVPHDKQSLEATEKIENTEITSARESDNKSSIVQEPEEQLSDINQKEDLPSTQENKTSAPTNKSDNKTNFNTEKQVNSEISKLRDSYSVPQELPMTPLEDEKKTETETPIIFQAQEEIIALSPVTGLPTLEVSPLVLPGNKFEYGTEYAPKYKLNIFAGLSGRLNELAVPSYAFNAIGVLGRSNKNLGLRAGFSFSQLNASTVFESESAIVAALSDVEDASDIPEIGTGGGGSNEGSGVDSIGVGTEFGGFTPSDNKFLFGEIFLGADYKLSKRFRLFAGARVRTLLFSQSNSLGLLNSPEGSFAATTSNSGIRVEDSAFYPNKFQAGAELGLDFKLTHRLSANASYYQSFRDVYPNVAGKQLNNFVQVGLNWQLR